MSDESNVQESEFTRKVLETSAGKFFKNLKEDEKLTQAEIEKRSKIVEHFRDETVKQCLHHAEVIVIWAVFLSIIALGFSYIWHLVTPWEYLPEDKLDNIKTILSSAILASIISARFKKYFS